MVAHRALVKGPKFAGPREGPGIWPLIAGSLMWIHAGVAAVGAIAGSVPDRL